MPKRGQSFILDDAGGFTLLETLIALTIAVLLVTVAASTLSVTLGAERALDHVEAARRLSEAWLAERYATGAATNAVARHADDWVFTVTEAETGPAENRARWEVWEIAPRDRPSAAWRICLRAAD
jgi:prepilin-type N-terminal cleavage/methylation domain-containing protein